MAPALDDAVVLEVATGVAGPYCGRLLCDLGARVIKVEPPGGDPLRTAHPLHNGESVFFNWLNAGKLGVELAPTDPRIEALVAHADIVVHDLRGQAADAFEARAAAANPGAVVLSLTPYGRSGPRSGWHASELTEYATSGYGYIAGDPAREPLALPGHQVALHAGLHGAGGALAALWHARRTGEGQRIEVSHQEAALSDHSWLSTIWTHQGVVQMREGSLFAPCADGFAFLFNLVPAPNLFILMERFDLLEDESRFAGPNWRARYLEILAAFSEWTATRTKQEVYHACQELRIAVTPVNTMADVAQNPQLLAREWFGSVEAGGARFQAPGFPYRLTGTPCVAPGPAPRLGEHTAALLEGALEPAAARRPEPVIANPVPGMGPLRGLRVIEVTANWAGPIAGRHLADLGADVIKVELATKPATRALSLVMDDATVPNHYHRSGYFNKLNRNKRAICLDLAKPEGRDVFLKLVASADVVLENNAARVMTNLGVGYDTLRETNPGIVLCSMAGLGGTGPERNYSAYGSNIETLSGLASLLGYDTSQFFGTGTFYADPLSGNLGFVAMLAALHARRRSGEGQWIDISLLEAATPFFAQPFLDYTTTGVVPVPSRNRSPDAAPSGYYPAAGRDCWVAITVADERDWAALCRVIGRDDLGNDPALQTQAGRAAVHDAIDAAIAAWTVTQHQEGAAAALQAAGIAAAPVLANWAVVMDNHLHGREFFVTISHPEAGTHPFPGFPWRFEKTPGQVERPAPLFAEHNLEVFRSVAGLDEATIAELYTTGVTGDRPIYGTSTGL